MGIPRGTLKVKTLNERAEFALQQEVIEWVLRENLIGSNVGRWDYINSREDMFHHDPSMVFPNPASVTMTEPSMSYYTRRNALIALLAGAMPIGGMAAQMQNPRSPELDSKALRDIWFDKLRERLTGLFQINGTLHDTYRQSWVARSPRLRRGGREPLSPTQGLSERRETSRTREALESGPAQEWQDPPLGSSSDPLWRSSGRRARTLAARPQGPTTEDGSYAMAGDQVHAAAAGQQRRRHLRPRTGLRFMNDRDLRDLYGTFLPGRVPWRRAARRRQVRSGRPRDAEALREVARRAARHGLALFAKLGVDYDKTDAELVLTILKRQVVKTTPDGSSCRSRVGSSPARAAPRIIEHPGRATHPRRHLRRSREHRFPHSLRAYDFV